jgi:hypothetical protein
MWRPYAKTDSRFVHRPRQHRDNDGIRVPSWVISALNGLPRLGLPLGDHQWDPGPFRPLEESPAMPLSPSRSAPVEVAAHPANIGERVARIDVEPHDLGQPLGYSE